MLHPRPTMGGERVRGAGAGIASMSAIAFHEKAGRSQVDSSQS